MGLSRAKYEGRHIIDIEQFGSMVGCFRKQSEFEHFVNKKGGIAVSRWLVEENLRESGCHGNIAGWSELIGGPTYYSFRIQPEIEPVDLREQLICAITGLSARVRFCATLAIRLITLPTDPKIYVTEQATLAYRWLKNRFSNVQGSEYFDHESRPALMEAMKLLHGNAEKLHFEDVTALSWDDEAFNAVLSFEVLEHVPDYRAALAEFHRVLKPGGYLILTAPFMQDAAHSVERAKLSEDGSIRHIKEPEYHGDPVRNEGALCFHNFGWDLLEEVRRSGFQDALMTLPWDYTQGLMGPLWTLVARR